METPNFDKLKENIWFSSEEELKEWLAEYYLLTHKSIFGKLKYYAVKYIKRKQKEKEELERFIDRMRYMGR